MMTETYGWKAGSGSPGIHSSAEHRVTISDAREATMDLAKG